MKKKLTIWLMALSLFVLPGCGILETVDSSINFATETTNYMNELTTFGQDMNEMAQQALTDPEARAALEQQLTDLKDQIASYADIQVPDYAKDLHDQIVAYNETLQQNLDQAIANVEQGKAAFEATGIPETLNKINELLGQLNALNPSS
ncbi:DUF6376 family protein [Paenibacillus soyae]|uniref:DUF6376 family protein n=1 Tax=Paenibacillus soyae TaxID=2969249 RepID=A0A9X2MLB2_9BACL|nr:DUF6376 family protein [Paenibacillus soyae]MCR2802751.1 DUF6376 family protein [Paenibacillus soyae]